MLYITPLIRPLKMRYYEGLPGALVALSWNEIGKKQLVDLV